MSACPAAVFAEVPQLASAALAGHAGHEGVLTYASWALLYADFPDPAQRARGLAAIEATGVVPRLVKELAGELRDASWSARERARAALEALGYTPAGVKV